MRWNLWPFGGGGNPLIQERKFEKIKTQVEWHFEILGKMNDLREWRDGINFTFLSILIIKFE